MSFKIFPTVDVFTTHDYRVQMMRVEQFSKWVHIDLMDGDFVPVKSPDINEVWWPHGVRADLHVMYRRPMDYLGALIRLKPHSVIIQAESEVHHMHFAAELHRHDVRAGLCILQDTPVANVKQILHSFDQIVIFSGHLGYQGGTIDLSLLQKVREIKEYYPEIEIAWDGGIDDQNIKHLAESGVTVFNVGGFIQKSANPEKAYATLKAIVNT